MWLFFDDTPWFCTNSKYGIRLIFCSCKWRPFSDKANKICISPLSQPELFVTLRFSDGNSLFSGLKMIQPVRNDRVVPRDPRGGYWKSWRALALNAFLNLPFSCSTGVKTLQLWQSAVVVCFTGQRQLTVHCISSTTAGWFYTTARKTQAQPIDTGQPLLSYS